MKKALAAILIMINGLIQVSCALPAGSGNDEIIGEQYEENPNIINRSDMENDETGTDYNAENSNENLASRDLKEEVRVYVDTEDIDGVFFMPDNIGITIEGIPDPKDFSIRLYSPNNNNYTVYEADTADSFIFELTGNEGTGHFDMEITNRENNESFSCTVLRNSNCNDSEMAMFNYQPVIDADGRIKISDLSVCDDLRNVKDITFEDEEIGMIRLVDFVNLINDYNYHTINGLNDSNIIIQKQKNKFIFGISRGDNNLNLDNIINSGGEITVYNPEDCGIESKDDIRILRYNDGSSDGMQYDTNITFNDDKLSFIVDSFGTYHVLSNKIDENKEGVVPVEAAPVNSKIKKGEYVYFGEYLGAPILWNVINIDEDGDALLWADNILTYKAFDAAQSGINEILMDGTLVESDKCDELTPGQQREAFGSNDWELSTLRAWLNSDIRDVSYTGQEPVRKALGFGEENEYADEPGFLYGFTDVEKSLIKPYTHKVILPECDIAENDGGDELHKWHPGTPSMAITNYDNSYYKLVTDKVFLPSIKEVGEYVENEWGYVYQKSPTKEAVLQELTDIVSSPGNPDIYWFRTPKTDSGAAVRGTTGEGGADYPCVANGLMGVCPALYISCENVEISYGDGTEENPFELIAD